MITATLLFSAIALLLFPVTRLYGLLGFTALTYLNPILMLSITVLLAWGYYYLKFKKRIIP
ncbi:hypothetical protein [Solemya velum gill symbiont]|uniref:Uncharacterized protein n=1 Tax=Solemya velum gill symbiont TaxID=2340 RepID=A0A0B0H4W1_SOVGS|nr:hypothetical protein [Solemya velum gill symbiont]KHF25248.1 hypothetical protein JV46_10400 [Solemya velum gill symbiont]OOY50533.1 hypothetical protein BOV97_10890 [Solemya velum gill symbiont]OOY54712.1 hypothetical protein BOV99_10085 [Solemya velum gill symbiont]OOY55357.1 hypothetical protein BOW00_10090 [Solemya velum gill symbiont]OOY59274.1 hypothetical protein BOW02_10315 [Solemya velum gill symbiont]